ncbi:MAG: ELM1/GtrOC1 family putative glycosyltransferase [Candidatus Omnitrophota bacterium]|nr:ELM1/GtrOC1 family putative glycosyltransferase [Candidatus Omnitrophota bacterium]
MFPTNPSINVLILSDGRPGHLKQCEAVYLELEKLYQSRGFSKEDVACETLEMKLKTKAAKKIVFYLTYLPRLLGQWLALRCLRSSLDRTRYVELMKKKADVIISPFGQRTIAVNLPLSRQCNAKSVVLMNPRSVIGKFDLAIVHRHSNAKEGKNTILTDGAPNTIERTVLEARARELRGEVGVTADVIIGLLVGGDYKRYRMSEDKIAALVRQVKGLGESSGAEFLVSTSLRTPAHIENLLRRELAGDPRCKLLVIANERNRPGAVEAILGLCDAVIVSPESVSMISEAASSGAHVLTFEDSEFLDDEHKRFLQNVERKGYLKVVDVTQIGKYVKQFLCDGRRTKTLDDRPAIRKGLESLVDSTGTGRW